MVVYSIVNLINGKTYIGQTRQPIQKRISQHFRKDSKLLIGRAIRKYGKDSFSWKVLENCSNQKELNEKEQDWIKKLNTTNLSIGYNLQNGGSKGKGVHPTTKRILSVKCSGWHHTEGAKKKISKAFRGTNHPLYGTKASSETLEKLRKSHLGQKAWNKGLRGYYKPTSEAIEKTRQFNLGRKITWGNKITKAKTRFYKEDFIEYIKKHPMCTIESFMGGLDIKGRSTVFKFGPFSSLKKEALSD